MMTSAITSALFMNSAVSKSIKYHYGLYTSIRKFAKKKTYNYDLDALLDWKKKTNIAFGSPLKLTKTGKIRKSKNNENENLKETLEILSAQSTHLSRYGKGYVSHFDVGESEDDIIILSSTDIPNEMHSHQVSAYTNEDVQSGSQFNSVTDLSLNVAYKYKPSSSNQIFEENTTNPVKRTSHKNILYEKENANDNNIHIPVISPIPSSNNDKPVSYNDNLKLNKSQFNTNKLPIEPPESFGIINTIPLDFMVNDSLDGNGDKFVQFKEDVGQLSLRKVPSVKSILNKTMPDLNRFFLSRWREKMIAELGEEGFKVHQEATINKGINFHANVMELLSGKPESDIQIMPDNEGHWASLQTAMKHISGVHALEEDMQHSVLLYRGVADCIAKYKDVLCVIDWKTSKKPRPLLKNTYDDPLQVAAYLGLVSANRENLKIGPVNQGLLVIIYPDGSPAHLHLMNQSVCQHYWKEWLDRLYHFYQLVYTEKFGGN